MEKLYEIAGDIDINQMEDGYVIYQAEKDRVHYLNHTAVLVLESCTGQASEDEIVRIVQEAFNLERPPEEEVTTCLETMFNEGLIQ